MKISEYSFMVIGERPHGNVGGIAIENYAVAIDSTGNLSGGRTFRKKLEEYYNLPIKYVILTHCHGDHISGRQAFKDADIVVSDYTPTDKGRFQNALFIKDEHLIQDGSYEVKIFHTGGHTVGSMFVHFPAEKIIFAGDLIFENLFPPFGGDPTCNPELWFNALDEIKTLKPIKIVPGHGPFLTGDKITNHISNLQKLRSCIKIAIKEKLKPSEIEITDYYGEFHPRWWSRTLPHWLSFYSTIDKIPGILEEIQSKSRDQNKILLSKMTVNELKVLANHLRIRVSGNKKKIVEGLLNYIEMR
ncbi:MAG: MBL fold metallo-hydrolase [Candidatus Heimdallarchaeota archaeon]|nr:MAG: MBL fold metallo-hydrolase [Candidatus Heimdallarchaeota archaeon]